MRHRIKSNREKSLLILIQIFFVSMSPGDDAPEFLRKDQMVELLKQQEEEFRRLEVLERAESPTEKGIESRVKKPQVSLNIFFKYGSTQIDGVQSGKQLQELIDLVRSPQFSGRNWIIEGHTDRSGSSQHNLVLSQARADMISAQIRKPPYRKIKVRAVGKGESDASGVDGTENLIDRKVVVILGD